VSPSTAFDRDPAVSIDPDFGLAAVSLGWVPAPRFLLRRDVVLRRMRALPRGKVLEIGCGAATLVAELDGLGFECAAVETSDAAQRLASRFLADHPMVRVEDRLAEEWTATFDYLLAFEVLEHIEDDTGALRSWVRCLKPGGRVLLSVPAHARRWTATDTWAGHVRRYDRAHFIALAERAGLRVERCDNYGFPLANLIEPVNAWAHARELRRAATRDERSGESGIKRTAETRLYPLMTSLPGRLLMRSAFAAQRWFAGSSLGNGFVLEAVKPA
jgi:SAM-dependent methyltransferase